MEERLDSGKGDDIFIVNEDRVKSLYSKGYFCDLSGLAGVQMLNKAAKAQAVIGDITYCIPVNMSAYALFVNLDVLKNMLYSHQEILRSLFFVAGQLNSREERQ